MDADPFIFTSNVAFYEKKSAVSRMVKQLKGRKREGGGLLGYRRENKNLSRRRGKNGNGDNRTSDWRVSHAKVTSKEQDGTLEQFCSFLEIGNEHHHLF